MNTLCKTLINLYFFSGSSFVRMKHFCAHVPWVVLIISVLSLYFNLILQLPTLLCSFKMTGYISVQTLSDIAALKSSSPQFTFQAETNGESKT